MGEFRTEIDNKIFEFAYYEALDDATKQNAYLGKKEEIASNESAKKIVKKYIDEIFAGKHPRMIDAAKKVNEAISNKEFTFGNIQKLINMTAKYFFLSCYADEKLRENFSSCHCPMDGTMMKKVKQEYRDLISPRTRDDLLLIPLGDGKTSIDLSKTAWSKLQFDNYDGPYSFSVYEHFQKMVEILAKEKGIMPIEYDFLKW